MLRRKPTALTISPEDIAAFEEVHAYNRARTHFQKTGQDPNGWFANVTMQAASSTRAHSHAHGHEDVQRAQFHQVMATDGHLRDVSGAGAAGETDPSDELKPLPGDKARIIRSREERIMGASGHAGAGSGAGATAGSGTRSGTGR